MKIGILEMNAAKSPQWVKKYQEYLEKEIGLDKLTAISAIGELCKLRRKYKETLDETELDKLAKKGIGDYAACASSFDTDTVIAMVDGYIDGFKDCYRKIKRND